MRNHASARKEYGHEYAGPKKEYGQHNSHTALVPLRNCRNSLLCAVQYLGNLSDQVYMLKAEYCTHEQASYMRPHLRSTSRHKQKHPSLLTHTAPNSRSKYTPLYPSSTLSLISLTTICAIFAPLNTTNPAGLTTCNIAPTGPAYPLSITPA